MTKDKKIQAVAEFIQVYGIWLVIIIVAIAFLAYYGVFDRPNWFPTDAQTMCQQACDNEGKFLRDYIQTGDYTDSCRCIELMIINETWGDTSD